MRRLLIALTLVSSTALGQTDLTEEMAELRQLVENQNRLLTEQSSQLQALTRRVAELEGQTVIEDSEPEGLYALEPDSIPPREPAEEAERTEAIDAEEIGMQQKQSLRTGKEAVIVEDAIALSDTMDIYGSMRLFVEAGADDPTLNDGSSRLGIRLGRDLRNGRTLFGRIEWKTNLVDNDSQFVVGDREDSGGIVIRDEDTEKVLSTRLGYLGMRFADVGEITFGKQWSVYYDVAGWTDVFNVYGGSALSVYSSGTDGGTLGSGRAENAVVWRNHRGRFSYGLQTQLKETAESEDFKGLGGSAIFSPNDDWDIGVAFAATRIKGTFADIAGDDDSGVATIGVRYHRHPWNVAFNVAKWDNHEAIFLEDDTLIYDGYGAELYASYERSDRMHIYGGFNYTDPDIDDERVDADFGIEALIIGASWFATEDSFAYLEALLSGSRDTGGERLDSVLSAGYRFDF